MFFKATYRPNPATGNNAGYYRLVESFRDQFNVVRHRTLLNVGFLEGYNAEQINQIRSLLAGLRIGKSSIFECEDSKVKTETERIWSELRLQKKIDVIDAAKWLDGDSIEHSDVRELGAEWLCFQAAEQLKIGHALELLGFSEQEKKLALTQIIARAIYPFSELKTTKILLENSALCELTAFPIQKMTKDALYTSALKLYDHKEFLEKYLSKRTNELFDIEDKIILFDLTNTYFEGEKRNSKLAKYGRSKEKRNDAKLIVLAMVTNQEGFIKYSCVHEGNLADPKSLPLLINELRNRTSQGTNKATVVIDAGIASEENLGLIKENGFDYVCVSRSQIKEYSVNSTHQNVVLTDKKHNKIELEKISVEGKTDFFLKVKSEGKALKEVGMATRFDEQFMNELAKIDKAIKSKGGIKKLEKVWIRIGRIKEKYPTASKFYEIRVQEDDLKENAVGLTYTKNALTKEHGAYFIQTTLDTQNSKVLWQIYNTIREIEATFRSLKTDLDLRPIYHKNDESTKAHINLALLAYWLVNTIRYQLKKKGVKHEWGEILRINQTVKWVQTDAKNMEENKVRIQKSSLPSVEVKELMAHIQYKPKFTKTKKSVVHKPSNSKIQNIKNQFVMKI